MATDPSTSAPEAVRPITLIPVGLKEAALDSPTFRSSFTHFSEQLELVEKWLFSYYRCVTRLTHELAPFEGLVHNFLAQTTPPNYISEAVLDHDYTLLAIKRYGEASREFWTTTLSGVKRMEANIVDPIKSFLHRDIQSFKDLKRTLEAAQKQTDSLQARYASQAKTKEPSALREDAFQLHESRKAYLKASMDFSVAAPQLRMNLDKLLVRIFSDQWRDVRDPRLNVDRMMSKWGHEIERIRGWSREMENGEKTFRKELQDARRQIEESAEAVIRPSRELEDYAVEASSASKQRGPSIATPSLTSAKPRLSKGEKQGWLNLRTVTGKPSRTSWLRRWFYVKNGIFGWLVQGSRSGAVEESEKIGVLLCNVRPANSDDRRYVFEVKTKDTTIVLQAETQPELNDWLVGFELAKQKALEDPASTDATTPTLRSQDPAFAISPPAAPEFAASAQDSGLSGSSDDVAQPTSFDRSSTLPIPGTDLAARNSFDVSATWRTPGSDTGESSRDPASKLMSKLDLHRKATGGLSTGGPAAPAPASGIAGLIAASHSSMPVGPGALPMASTSEASASRKISTSLATVREMPISTLAPNTLANPPAPTNLSAAAVIVNGDRGIGLARPDSSGGLPSGLLANVWGSTNWGFINRLERGEVQEARGASGPPVSIISSENNAVTNKSSEPLGSVPAAITPSPSRSPHRKTISLGGDESTGSPIMKAAQAGYPNYYPLQLKTQDAQFRLLFPNVADAERVLLVFKATWNPNEQQEFPGRVYVTAKEIYFYSNHAGMTMTTSLRLDSIGEVTAGNGKDWDVVFLHLKDDADISGFTRITIKTFLEPLKLLQRRLSFLIRNASADSASVEEILKTLIKLEHDDSGNSPSEKSWENVSINTPIDADGIPLAKESRDLRTNVFIDQGLYGDDATKPTKSFKLPKQPVVFVPSGMDEIAVEKEFQVSPKALFHVLFGDRSAVWQLLYYERQVQRIRQGPWSRSSHEHLRRDFEYEIEWVDILRRVQQSHVSDHQTVDVATEHLLYIVSDRKTPWHLPRRQDFSLLSKIVITYVSKSRCKLALYSKVDWHTNGLPFGGRLIRRAALQDMKLDALDLVDVISDQIRRFVGAQGGTKKAIAIFGMVGQQPGASEFAGTDPRLNTKPRRARTPRTLTTLVLQSTGSMAETVIASTLQIIGNCIRLGWKTFTVHYLIIVLLFLSFIANISIGSQRTTEWLQQRGTEKVLSRLGIGANHVIEKAIYISDVEQAISISSPSEAIVQIDKQSVCRQTFENLNNHTLFSPDLSFTYSSGSPERPFLAHQASAAARLQRTRHHLGTRRHDLLVALRVVNSVEREMIRAEWEKWLMEENLRCQLLGALLQKNETVASGEGLVDQSRGGLRQQMSEERRQEVRQWYESYCESCKGDAAQIPKF